ncbi:hypothetical protein [Candidatus Skiveiella danica]
MSISCRSLSDTGTTLRGEQLPGPLATTVIMAKPLASSGML